MSASDETRTVPEGVRTLLHDAVRGHLLEHVDAMAAALLQAGWTRETAGGSWSYTADPTWNVVSSDHAPHVSIFTQERHEALTQLASSIIAFVESGQAGPLLPGGRDPDWRVWSSGKAVISMNVSPERRLRTHLVPAVLHLALGRPDTPLEGLPADPRRARQLAREGSPVARWYLAGEDQLPDDVVALLATDHDPTVVVALNKNSQQRRDAREHPR